MMSYPFLVYNIACYFCTPYSLHCALASCSAVYCNRSYLWDVTAGGQAGGVCYHDNSKLRASIFTKLGL